MSDSWPWFPIYVDDFLASPKVRRMDAHAVGVYFLLLLEQWQVGPISDPPAELAVTLRTTEVIVEKVLAACFKSTPKGWVNTKLESVRKEQQAKSERRREAAKARWRRASDANAPALDKQSEPEPDPEPDTSPSERTRAKRKRKVALPADWQPNEGHRKRAKQEGVDLGKEAEKFRLHHEARGSTFVSWDKAFTTWLLRAKDFQPRGRHTPESETDHWDREIERFRDFGKPKPGLERLSVDIPRTA